MCDDHKLPSFLRDGWRVKMLRGIQFCISRRQQGRKQSRLRSAIFSARNSSYLLCSDYSCVLDCKLSEALQIGIKRTSFSKIGMRKYGNTFINFNSCRSFNKLIYSKNIRQIERYCPGLVGCQAFGFSSKNVCINESGISSIVAGFHFGLLSRSTSRARTPSGNSWRRHWYAEWK
jgi:hypothetical protein